MKVFDLRDRLVDEYASYTRSFIRIADDRIREHVDRELDAGLLWPEPIVQLNPAFERGESIDELVQLGVLHPECARIFRIKKEPHDAGSPLHLHRHQADAIKTARTGGSYVLTTGTGSGKSLAYIIPIVDRVLREGPGRGVKAIVAYPMNALANSQMGELEKFINYGYPNSKGPVTFCRYTGQESDQERTEIIAHPPDILLTNYVMLELILTRPAERKGLVRAAKGLKFFVLDELHTYRGRQGADVSLLVRRVREACQAPHMQCVGTSATLVGADTLVKQREEISKVSGLIFGADVSPGAVVTESLRRATRPDAAGAGALRERLSEDPPIGFENFIADPLAGWIESTVGLTEEPESGALLRAKPRQLKEVVDELAKVTGAEPDLCQRALAETLLAGYEIKDPKTGFPVFAFRLHQFFSRGETVYATAEAEAEREITTYPQLFVPGDRTRVLLPLAFCRECGQEYYTVRREDVPGEAGHVFVSREVSETEAGGQGNNGFLYLNTTNPWPQVGEATRERIPDDWLTPDGGDIRRDRDDMLPRPIWVAPDGRQTSGEGTPGAFVKAPFRFCLNCRVSYVERVRRDFGKLTTLGAGGRASASTILGAAAVRSLRSDNLLKDEARKLLSFTDNRQDASLQAGHFNDFIEVGLLRSALYQAASAAGGEGVPHEELAQRVTAALDLPLERYARDPTVRFAAREETDKALRDVIGYRLYRDLDRGWRVTAPNLEQTGLLHINYVSLDEVASAADVWAGAHPVLAAATPGERLEAAAVLLDFMRKELAIRVDYLNPQYQDALKQRSNQHLASPWALDEEEELERAKVIYPRSRQPHGHSYGAVFVSGRSYFGMFLERKAFRSHGTKIPLADREEIIRDLLAGLRVGGLVEVVDEPNASGDVPGYQVKAAGLRWVAGDGSTPGEDPLRVANLPADRKTNRYFVDFYRSVASDGIGLTAREHTAQVPAEEREKREREFRKARLPVLFCSPTMELGVDIAELNVVNMRNVPPTPANYAQRSGRAGRSGQPALVYTYCAAGSSHDQYFFRRPGLMVSGQVRPPQIDLTNEDLVRAHVHAVWLAETDQSLGSSLAEILDTAGEHPSLALNGSVRESFSNPLAKQKAVERCTRLLKSIPDLQEAGWCTPGWLESTLDGAVLAFEQASERWRTLYRTADETWYRQNAILADASRSVEERKRARQLRDQAETQRDLLRADTSGGRAFSSDFYSYRYYASEGFLPGYNFPRLPLSAFIPGRRGAAGRDEFLSRPRFLAITEFGPRSIVYHEGSRYVINRVMLPTERDPDNRLPTAQAKICSNCGYVHPLAGTPGPDLCEHCGKPLDLALSHLFRLQNVATKRRERINSDEEERLRYGFEVQTALRFADAKGKPRVRTAVAKQGQEVLASMSYSAATTIWRINLGRRRRANPGQHGFVLDTQQGYWESEDALADPADPMSAARERVIPFVEDHRNALLLTPAGPEGSGFGTGQAFMASLGAALKSAIQVEFQLEEQELAAEALPNLKDRRTILLYEAAEGGAGALRKIATDPHALTAVAQRALELCHFDPETGEDRFRAEGAPENCEAACYDCLMSYVNQPDHRLLDRKLIRDYLLQLAGSTVEVSPEPLSRQAYVNQLLNLCQSELERRFVSFLDESGCELPSRSQSLLAECRARPDFLYDSAQVAVFIDGPVHGFEDVATRDRACEDRLEDAGWTAVRFPEHPDAWPEIVHRWPHVFGRGSKL